MLHASAASRAVVWTLVIAATVGNALGYLLNLYDRFAWFDEVIHFYTMFALSLTVGLALYDRTLTGRRGHPVLLVATVTLIGLGIGAVWEMAEWAYDHLSGPRSTIKQKWDTIVDLIVDGGGALLAGLLTVALARETGDGPVTRGH